VVLSIGINFNAYSQINASILPSKPQKYEKRQLSSDLYTDKKINPFKKGIQNLTTHYNFFFNAERKLNSIIAEAKLQNIDNYELLLPFFPYNLEKIASNKIELDSVIGKSNDAILLHDLRSDWVDDLFFLMGKAYFFKGDYDSATIAFQFINYSFQPKRKDEQGYNKIIGSNINTTGNVFNISTPESKNPLILNLSRIPVRNEALLWIIRTYLEKHSFFEASGLIETLKRDKDFPERLQAKLNDLQAYQFYLQENYDSAANYLQKAIKSYSSKEKPRTAFLIAQLYQKAGNNKLAFKYFEEAINNSLDPTMEAYARIYQIQILNGNESESEINKNLAELKKMAGKEKYADYRAMIYYAAAKIETLRNNQNEAIKLLFKGTTFNRTNIKYRNLNFKLLGDLAFDERKYEIAANAYDSLDFSSPSLNSIETIKERKIILKKLTTLLSTIYIQDSLLRIEAMPEKERTLFLKDQAKKIRKAQGLKDNEDASLNAGNAESSVVAASGFAEKPVNLFQGNEAKGEWYFYNNNLKTQGFKQFKTVWGNRPNVDNWRRIKAIMQAVEAQKAVGNFMPNPGQDNNFDVNQNIEKIKEPILPSKDTLLITLFNLSKIYREELNDCYSLISNNEELLNQFPNSIYNEEIVFGLYNCFKIAGNKEKTTLYKKYIDEHFPQSKFFRLINDPKSVEKEKNAIKNAATTTYENIYNFFVEGNFTKAFEEKKKADTLYGESFWTPQLLYIEAIYHIKKNNDSLAIITLEKIVTIFPNSIIAEKSKTLIKTLKDRKTTEAYLQNLQIKRAIEDSNSIPKKPLVINQATDTNHIETNNSIPISKSKTSLTTIDSSAIKKAFVKTDTIFAKPQTNKTTDDIGYTYNPNDEQLIIVQLEKVDAVYRNEAQNALKRYNSQHYYNNSLSITTFSLSNNTELLIISTFKSDSETVEYLEKIKLAALIEIFPWMPKDKFSFFNISGANLEILKTNKNLSQYAEWLKKHPLSK
jgi:hypothetical protein